MKFFLLVLVFALTGCASKSYKKDLVEKAQKSEVSTPQALSHTIREAIERSAHLSPEQKNELEKIFVINKTRADELTEESFKFRSVLISELFSEKSDGKKIRFIKKTIAGIEKQRLENTLTTIEKVRKVTAGNPDEKKISEALLHFDRPIR